MRLNRGELQGNSMFECMQGLASAIAFVGMHIPLSLKSKHGCAEVLLFRVCLGMDLSGTIQRKRKSDPMIGQQFGGLGTEVTTRVLCHHTLDPK